MVLPGRNYAVAGGNYRYGFNGKQKENEITEGDYDFDERMYDSRLGRFFSTDPEQENNVLYTPYAFANNNPITLVDEDGLSAAGPPWLELLSAGLDFVPIVGTIKNIAEAAIGRDLAGNELSPAERMLMVMPGGAIINKGSKAVKFVAKHADDIARGVTKVFKKVAAKSKEIYNKIDDGVENISNQISTKVDRKLLNPPKKPGDAPTFISDGSTVELHHVDGTHKGSIKEMHWFDHRGKGNYSKNHPKEIFKNSKINRKQFKLEREKYWKGEYKGHFRKQKVKKFFKKIASGIKKTFKKRYNCKRIKAKF